MDKETRDRYERGRRLLKELEGVMDNYQKLQFFLDTRDPKEDSRDLLYDQSFAMKDYIDVLIKRIEEADY